MIIFEKYVFYILLITTTTPLANTNNFQIVVNTWDFTSATTEAWRILNDPNSSALDALVAGCSRCEYEQCDGTVGYGGSPDENAETTLDAMIMDGTSMNIGAVANLRRIKDAIKVARHVLENTRHSIIAGDQATEFAKQMGFTEETLSTSKSKELWKTWRNDNCQPNFWENNVTPNPENSCGPYTPIINKYKNQSISTTTNKFNFGKYNHDTIGMIIIDKAGKTYAGTSTNGAKFKIPGRVGDSPIPGAGAYATDIGASAATGDGDIMMRFLPAFTAVENLRNGFNVQLAARNSIDRILKYYPNFTGGIVVASNKGQYSAACAGMEKFPFSVIKGDARAKVKVEYVECNK